MARGGGLGLAPVLGAAAIVVLGIAAAVFWPTSPTSLSVMDPQSGLSGFAAKDDLKPGRPYLFDTVGICVKHGPVTINSVRVHEPTGSIEVVDWGVSPPGQHSDKLGDPGRVSGLAGYSHRAVTASCRDATGPDDFAGQSIAIAVRFSGKSATTLGFEVHSSNGTVVVPYGAGLCAATCSKSLVDHLQSGTP